MRKTFNIHFVESFKKYLILSGSIMLIGVIFLCIFGTKLDITFSGGTNFTYTYEGKIDKDKLSDTAEDILKGNISISETTNYGSSSNEKNLVITVIGNKSVKQDLQDSLTSTLEDNYSKQNLKFASSNSVNPTLAGSFFAKSLAAVALAAVLIVLYVGIRFRKIGGVSAGISGFIALIHDVLIAFFVCVIFRLPIDTNFMAVVLTILGYSINDTIVIFDRVREDEKFYPDNSVRQNVNLAVNQTLNRTIMTSITTFLAIASIAIVAELFGVTALRSFAIPMGIGVISGCYSSICIAGPIWVRWCELRDKKGWFQKTKKKKKK